MEDKQKEIRDIECQITDVNREFDELMYDFLSREGILKRQMARDKSKDVKKDEAILSDHTLKLIKLQEDNLRKRMKLFDEKIFLVNKLETLKKDIGE